MVTVLPQFKAPDEPKSGGCGTSCGSGLEKIYPTTAVRYGAMRYIGEFSYKPGTVFKCGAKVVIQSDRGIELGEQVSLTCNGCEKSVNRDQIKRYVENSGAEFYRLGSGRILREATQLDIDEHEHLNRNLHEDLDRCALLGAQAGLDMKVVTVEHLLGGERIIFYFRSEDRIDFRPLVKELAQHYRTRIEMRQVGARDEARLVADYEVCGRECCCKNFLKKLRPVNMKMAKLQKSTLDPSKVSGRCGRLRCCLRYEHESYEALTAKLPRVGSRVGTAHGEGMVVDRQILTQLVLIRTDDQRELAVPLEEISAFDVPMPKFVPPTDRDSDVPPADASRRRPQDRRGPRRDERPPRRASVEPTNRDVRRPPPPETSSSGEPDLGIEPADSAEQDARVELPDSASARPPRQDHQPPRSSADGTGADRPRRDRRRRRRRRGGPPGSAGQQGSGGQPSGPSPPTGDS